MSVRVKGLSKRLGRPGSRIEILRSVDCNIPSGQVVGLLGRNGAGKTTLLRMLVGQAFPNEGSIEWSLPEARRAWLPEGRCFAPVGSARDWQPLFEPLDRDRLDDLKELFDVGRLWDRPIRQLSTGERRKAELCLTLSMLADAFVFDEPTSGLDPLDVEHLHRELSRLAECQATVLVSTHLVREHEDVVDYVLILDGGTLVASGSADHLRRDLAVLSCETAPDPAPPGTKPDGARLLVPRQALDDVARHLRAWGIGYEEGPAGLKDVFRMKVGVE